MKNDLSTFWSHFKALSKTSSMVQNYENRITLFHFIGNQKFELMTSQRRVIIKEDLQKRGFFNFFYKLHHQI